MRRILLPPVGLPRRALLLAVLATALMALAAIGHGAGAGEVALDRIASRIEARLDRAGVPAGEVGVVVLRRGPAHGVVFARGEDRSLIPASVGKVLTSAAALDLLGPGHVFTTTLSARGKIDAATGRLTGDLVVHGTGDPNVSGRLSGGEPTAVLDELALAVRTSGIREVTGDLVLDDGPFDREFFHPGWSEADRGHWYGAPVCGLSYNDSCVDLVVRPSSGGARGIVDVPSTAGPWPVENLTTLVTGSKHLVGGAWVKSGTVLRVTGQVARGKAPYAFNVPVEDPLAYFGGAFMKCLGVAGVKVAGTARPVRDAADRQPGRVLARHGSGLGDTLAVMNKRSQNFYAALLFKACGASREGVGSWDSGSRAVEETLRRRGLSDGGLTKIVDGSGLSAANRATAATLANLLLSLDGDLLRGPMLHDSLAVPGEEGTLDDRLDDVPALKARLHAKTGTLGNRGVHAMVGYVDGEDGAPGHCFAILVNARTWKGDARGLIDGIVRDLVAP